MWDSIAQTVISGLLGGVVTGIAAIAAIKVQLQWLRSDLRNLSKDVDEAKETAAMAHHRIDMALAGRSGSHARGGA